MPTDPAFSQQLLDALDALSGLHPGYRPVHVKGVMCSGTFTPTPEAAQPTRAPHSEIRSDLYLLSGRRRRTAGGL